MGCTEHNSTNKWNCSFFRVKLGQIDLIFSFSCKVFAWKNRYARSSFTNDLPPLSNCPIIGLLFVKGCTI